jgi:hypothetical protein
MFDYLLLIVGLNIMYVYFLYTNHIIRTMYSISTINENYTLTNNTYKYPHNINETRINPVTYI